MQHKLSRKIKYVEDNIKALEKAGRDATFERNLVKAWKKVLRAEGDIDCTPAVSP
uniref:Uncharacterized protein n=1 Tax=viral metagenome TaxID=1070528 RepID=A0A6M3LPG3_9ZZZZ